MCGYVDQFKVHQNIKTFEAFVATKIYYCLQYKKKKTNMTLLWKIINKQNKTRFDVTISP